MYRAATRWLFVGSPEDCTYCNWETISYSFKATELSDIPFNLQRKDLENGHGFFNFVIVLKII
jgi:hypothetical protein